MKRRILALSRDRGSMQAIAPVIAALDGTAAVEVSTYAARESWPVTVNLGVRAAPLDETAFTIDPGAYVRSLVDDHRPDLILCGSSPVRGPAPETPEQFAILEARRRGLPSLAVQDYWGMYAERFSRDGTSLDCDLLPDRLCVLDRRALADLGTFGVPGRRMSITHNPWLDRLVDEAAAAVSVRRTSDAITVLLVSQPLAEMRHVRGWPYDQYTLFEYLLAAVPQASGGRRGATIQVLPHPSEDVSRWKTLLAGKARTDVNVEIRCREPGLLASADYIVTSHSTLAYEALYFGSPCISLRPGLQSPAPHWIDELGLAQVFYNADALRRYLIGSDPDGERQKIIKLKRELSAAGLFFSDGNATRRVVKEIAGLLDCASEIL